MCARERPSPAQTLREREPRTLRSADDRGLGRGGRASAGPRPGGGGGGGWVGAVPLGRPVRPSAPRYTASTDAQRVHERGRSCARGRAPVAGAIRYEADISDVCRPARRPCVRARLGPTLLRRTHGANRSHYTARVPHPPSRQCCVMSRRGTSMSWASFAGSRGSRPYHADDVCQDGPARADDSPPSSGLHRGGQRRCKFLCMRQVNERCNVRNVRSLRPLLSKLPIGTLSAEPGGSRKMMHQWQGISLAPFGVRASHGNYGECNRQWVVCSIRRCVASAVSALWVRMEQKA